MMHCLYKFQYYKIMKKLACLIAMGLITLISHAQEEGAVDSKTTKKLTKEQKLEQRRLAEEETAKKVDMMVDTRRFVLEAYYLSNQTGQRINVSSVINFVAIDSSKATIQLASVSGIGGPNAMGGVTTDGSITKYEVVKTGRDKRNYSIHVITMTTLGTYDIWFDIFPNANADARISGNRSGKLNYHGKLVPLSESKVYKGMSL